MKSAVLLAFAVGACLSAGPGAAGAAGDLDDFMVDRLGIYFDQQANEACLGFLPPFVPFTMYIILTGPTFGELHRWEAAVQTMGGSFFVMSTTVGFGGVNEGVWPDFAVSLPAAPATSGLMVLASVQIMATSFTPSCLVLTGISTPSLPEPWPLVWPDAVTPLIITRNAPFPNGVTAVIGDCGRIPESPPSYCETVVADSPTSWGKLKARFR